MLSLFKKQVIFRLLLPWIFQDGLFSEEGKQYCVFLHSLPIFRPTLCGSLNRRKSGKSKERTWEVGCTLQGTKVFHLRDKEHHLQKCLGREYVNSQECMCDFLRSITFLFTSMSNLRYILGSLQSFQRNMSNPSGQQHQMTKWKSPFSNREKDSAHDVLSLPARLPEGTHLKFCMDIRNSHILSRDFWYFDVTFLT